MKSDLNDQVPDTGSSAKISPNFADQIAQSGDSFVRALRDPIIATKLAEALELAEEVSGDESIARRIAEATEALIALIHEHHPRVFEIFGTDELRNTFAYFLEPDKRSQLPPPRLKRPPDYDYQPVWLLINDNDAEALKRELKPGQVWVNASGLDHDKYVQLWGLISYQLQRLGRAHRASGRPPGSVSRTRADVAREIREQPDLTYPQIYSLALDHGLWRDDGGFYENLDRNRKRVIRLKKLAEKM